MNKFEGLPGESLSNSLAHWASEYPVEVKETDGYILAQISTEVARDRILDLHGRNIRGKPLSVSRYRAKMSAMQILDWIEGTLHISETAAGWSNNENIHAFMREADKGCARSQSPKRV